MYFIWDIRKGIDKKEFTVSKNENENVIKVLYEPKLAKVTIQLINEIGAKIASPIQKLCQIGDEFSSVSLNEVTDNYGKMWEKKEGYYRKGIHKGSRISYILYGYGWAHERRWSGRCSRDY
mgnify:CR=1 FL=1